MTRPPLLLAVPNISEGRRSALVREVAGDDNALLDIDVDPDHNRSVLTLAAPRDELVAACAGIIDRAVELLDIREHTGAHPRFGVVDVLPLVPYEAGEAEARRAAGDLAQHAAHRQVPVYLYGGAAAGAPSLPDLRRTLRAAEERHETAGVLCIGVRAPLVAFNVNITGNVGVARTIAGRVRELPHVRALGFELPSRRLRQVSMNLVRPEETGPRAAYERVAELADEHSVEIADAEIVGLVAASIQRELTGIPLRRRVRTLEEAIAKRRGRKT